MRLIDADVLLEVLNKYKEEYDGKDANGFYNLKYCAIMEALNAVDEQPTVAAATEANGRWEIRNDGPYGRARAYCTACRKHSGIGGIRSNQLKPYCPNCGARMDGDEGES